MKKQPLNLCIENYEKEDLSGNVLLKYSYMKELQFYGEELKVDWEITDYTNDFLAEARYQDLYIIIKWDKNVWSCLLTGKWKKSSSLKEAIEQSVTTNVQFQNYFKKYKKKDDNEKEILN